MRTEKEMMSLFEKIVKNDDKIRLSVLEGSRTNKNIPKDDYQDYDLSFFVDDINDCIQDEQWIQNFGELIFMQKPEAMELFEPELRNGFSYLMYFKDSVKIDLTIIPVKELNEYLAYSDGLVEVLIDKDNRIKEKLIPTDEEYWIKKPTEEHFRDCCNEFWHVSTYVAKGLAREELLYSLNYINNILRPELLRMMSWEIGVYEGYSLSLGKNYKFIKEYLSEEKWEDIMDTFSLSTPEEILHSFQKLCQLFREQAQEISLLYGYHYPTYDEKITDYIQQVYDINLY